MKKIALLLALAGLGLAAAPSHAQAPALGFVGVNVQPNFTATLTDFSGAGSVDILALNSASPALNYAAGTFAYDGPSNLFFITNLTFDPSEINFATPGYNVATPLEFDNLMIKETFAAGPAQTINLSASPLDNGTVYLTAPPVGTALPQSAVLTGFYNPTPNLPNKNGTVAIQTAVALPAATVPETGTSLLLLVGLALAALPALSARVGRRSQ